jgi:hypothetical protein
MTQAALKADILELMRTHQKGVTCTELSKIENFSGEFTWHLGRWTNVVIWTGMSKDAIDVMAELIRDKRIDIMPAHWLAYLIDGAIIVLPIFKCGDRPPEYNPPQPHWLPVYFNLTEGIS